MTDERISLDILRTLALKVRFLTSEQVATEWYDGGGNALSSAADMLADLESRQLVSRTTIEIRSAGCTEKPVFSWTPAAREPSVEDWERLAERFAVRWSPRLLPVEVFSAAPRTANLFGARPVGAGRPCEWSHDYRLTEVFLRYRKASPDAAARWKGEAARPKWGRRIPRMKDPDAMLIDQECAIDKVIEVAGKYSPAHLVDLHQHCAGTAFERLEQWQANGHEHRIRNPYQRGEIGYELW